MRKMTIALLAGLILTLGASLTSAIPWTVISDTMLGGGKGILLVDVGSPNYVMMIRYFDRDQSGDFSMHADQVYFRERVARPEARPITRPGTRG